MADKTIGDLTQAASIGGEDLFVLEQNSEAKKLKGSQLVQYAQDAVGAQVTAATSAAESAETAKTGAESAQTQAQAARDAILNMIVEAITLEQGSPATVEKSLVDSVYKLTFGLPSGKNGDPGPAGKDGVTPEIVEGELVEVPSAGGGTDPSLGITGATVGQIAKITAVDTSGKPTAWEPVDMASGGGGDEWELIAHINVADDVGKDVTVWQYNNLPRYKYIAYKKVNLVGSTTQAGSGCSITINNENTQSSGMSYGKSGSPQSCIGMIYVTPFGWTHCKTGDATTPTNYSFGGVSAMYCALPLSDNAITSIKLSAHTTYKIASGEIWLYGKKG